MSIHNNGNEKIDMYCWVHSCPKTNGVCEMCEEGKKYQQRLRGKGKKVKNKIL